MKKVLLVVWAGLFFFCSCAGMGLKPNRGVTADNVYYSTALPELRIRINPRFEHMQTCNFPEYTNVECFQDYESRDAIIIGTEKGIFDPDKAFGSRKLISSGMKYIHDKPFYVGTDVFYSEDLPIGNYLRRAFVHYPDLQHAFSIILARPLPDNDQFQWTNPKKFTGEQSDMIEDFAKSQYRFFTEN